MLARLLRFRSLLAALTGRELKARYRGSFLGFFWSLVNPLLLLGVYSLVFGWVFAPRIGGAEPYAVFLVCGLFPWIWFSGSLLESTASLTANAALIRKAVFPAEVLPLVTVLSHLVHLLLALPILLAAVFGARLAGYAIGGWSALLLPAVLAFHVVFTSGLAFALAALNVLFKDVRDLLGNLLTLLFFLSPILYPFESVAALPVVPWLVRLNPVTPFVLAYQEVLFRGSVPGPGLWLQVAVLSLLAWGIGAWIFTRLEDVLVEAV
jgi:lipopolysaccharide transport system permease protein